MEYKKGLLGAASLLALSVGFSQPTQAALRAETPTKAASAGAQTPVAFGDPLLTLITRTSGSLSPELVEDVVIEMFSNPANQHPEELLRLFSGLDDLGVPSASIATIKRALADIVSSSDLDEAARQSALAVLETTPSAIRLAQTRRPRDPSIIGQVGGGGGGGYR